MRTPVVDASVRPPEVGQVWRRRRNGAPCRVVTVDTDARTLVKVHRRATGELVRRCTWEQLVTEYVLVIPAR